MADEHHSLRLPYWLWSRYEAVVGNIGRTPDLKRFMDWRIEEPDVQLGEDVELPYQFTATFRIESTRWDLFAETVGEGDVSADLRRYIWWRVQNPKAPLPGRRLPPMPRRTRRLAGV